MVKSKIKNKTQRREVILALRFLSSASGIATFALISI